MKTNTIISALIVGLLLIVFIVPVTGFAQGGLVPCSGLDCDFSKLVILIQRVLNFLLYLAVFICTMLFAWAGFILITSGGNPSAKSRAKNMFWDAMWGLIFMAAAWLIVRVILETLQAKPWASQFLGIFN